MGGLAHIWSSGRGVHGFVSAGLLLPPWSPSSRRQLRGQTGLAGLPLGMGGGNGILHTEPQPTRSCCTSSQAFLPQFDLCK